jgi:hypothetical protein
VRTAVDVHIRLEKEGKRQKQLEEEGKRRKMSRLDDALATFIPTLFDDFD